MRNPESAARIRAGAAVVASLLLALGLGCSLDKQSDPDLAGPSDAGISVELMAATDLLNADGVSSTSIRLILRDDKGRPIVGRSVLFSFDGDGTLMAAPGSIYVGPVQTGLVMATNSNGAADVIYVAGRGIGDVIIGVRPYGFDTAMPFNFFKTITITQV